MVVDNARTGGHPPWPDGIQFGSSLISSRPNGPGTDAPPDPEQAPGPPSVVQAKKSALAFLTYRSRTGHEIRRHLEGRYSGEVADLVVNWLNDRGFINDAAFARDWRDRRERRRPSGEGRIRRELLELGIAPEVADRALEGYDSKANARQAASTWLAKHRPKGTSHDRAKLRRRLWGYLERRGFESELISQTVRDVGEELSHPLDSEVDADG